MHLDALFITSNMKNLSTAKQNSNVTLCLRGTDRNVNADESQQSAIRCELAQMSSKIVPEKKKSPLLNGMRLNDACGVEPSCVTRKH